jgi:hypothetical protein
MRGSAEANPWAQNVNNSSNLPHNLLKGFVSIRPTGYRKVIFREHLQVTEQIPLPIDGT